MKIYLDEFIEIDGIKIGLTYEGLKYRIGQFERFLSTSKPEQLGTKEREHIKWLIENYSQHLILYERQQGSPKV